MAKRTDRPRSNGSKPATCAMCGGEVQPYAGRALSLYGAKFAHHPGQCRDATDRAEKVRAEAHQGTLFSFSCQHLEVGGSDASAVICDVMGTDRADYASHMKLHGRTPVKTEPRIRLRKAIPAAKLDKPNVAPFKTLRWTKRTYSDWTPEHGQTCTETEVRGQYWSNGEHPHSVVAITYTPYGSGIRPELVTLYLRADGSVTPDWSEAKWSRRAGNRQARRAA